MPEALGSPTARTQDPKSQTARAEGSDQSKNKQGYHILAQCEGDSRDLLCGILMFKSMWSSGRL